MSHVQQHAISCFTTMLQRARKYRETGSCDSDLFYTGYGICDNIARCMPNGASESQLSTVKDNLIRAVPSYSGNYHYPVRHPAPRPDRDPANEAESAWDQTSNRWDGDYGAERIIQLEELLDHVTNKWQDAYAYDMSPASRLGIVKDLTICIKTTDNSMWILSKDDNSSDPYFVPVGGGDRQAINVRYLKVLPAEGGEKRSVAGFISRIRKHEKARRKLEEKALALKKEIDALKQLEVTLDYHLAHQHGVRRIAKSV